jgi:hypothetical protein
MIFKDNTLIREIVKSSKTDLRVVRKVLVGLYIHMMNELMFKGETKDYLFDVKFNKEKRQFEIIGINEDFKKILQDKIDPEFVKKLVDESEFI